MAIMNQQIDMNLLIEAGWVHDDPDLFFYSSRGRETQLKLIKNQRLGTIDCIYLRKWGQDIGKVYNGATGLVDLSLLEVKLDVMTAREFMRAIKPVL